LTYRLADEPDIPALVRLWERDSGWGGMSEQTWRSWYVDLPWGPSLTVIAVDGDEVVGQEIFTPVRVRIDGRAHRGLRLSAPILRSDRRRTRLRDRDHPIVRMLDLGLGVAAEQGYELVYAMPESSWLSFFRWYGRFHYYRYPCVAQSLRSPSDAPTTPYVVRPLERFSACEDWVASAMASIGEGAVVIDRSRAWLDFRNGGHLVLEVREAESGSMAGYVAVERTSGLVADLLARSRDAVGDVLAAVLQHLSVDRTGLCHDVNQLRLMRSPMFAPVAKSLGFEETGYAFLFACVSLTGRVPADRVVPDRWYLVAKD
jgi:hypothetical protein